MIHFIVALSLSALAVGAVRRLALRRGLIDRPNDRSSHTTPTPRGGGLGVLIVLLGVFAASVWRYSASSWPLILAFCGVAVTALVGWLDDSRHVPVRARLAVHVAAGLLVLPLVRVVPMPDWPTLVLAAWWVFWVVSAINVVNFMDGIDGFIGLQAVVFGLHGAVNGQANGGAQLLGWAIAGAGAGFLVWNWSPARIFLGDVGSGALGLLFVIEGALLTMEDRVGFSAAFLPLAPIFLDAAVTLARRVVRNERLGEAHRSHLYQRLANGGMGHARVTLLYGAAATLAAAVAFLRPEGGMLQVLIVLASLGLCGTLAAKALNTNAEIGVN